MKSLADILLAPQQRDALIADAASMVEQHIQQRGGLKGIGMKTGLSLLKAARPDILQRASARMLPDMITALEPLYTQFRNSGDGDFAVFLVFAHIRGLHAGGHVPVDVTDVVVRLVFAQIGQHQTAASKQTAVVTLQLAIQPFEHGPFQPLQPLCCVGPCRVCAGRARRRGLELAPGSGSRDDTRPPRVPCRV